MKKWITKKLNIVLIAGGVLIISTVMLITGIYFAKTAEENKVIKTAYAADDAVKEEVLGTSDGNAAEEEANDTEQTDAPELTDDTVALSESAIESPAVEPPAPVATGTQEPGPENITADQAMDTMIEYTEKV